MLSCNLFIWIPTYKIYDLATLYWAQEYENLNIRKCIIKIENVSRLKKNCIKIFLFLYVSLFLVGILLNSNTMRNNTFFLLVHILNIREVFKFFREIYRDSVNRTFGINFATLKVLMAGLKFKGKLSHIFYCKFIWEGSNFIKNLLFLMFEKTKLQFNQFFNFCWHS